MARLLNSHCNFENGFFACDLPEDAVLLVFKVKTKNRKPHPGRGYGEAN